MGSLKKTTIEEKMFIYFKFIFLYLYYLADLICNFIIIIIITLNIYIYREIIINNCLKYNLRQRNVKIKKIIEILEK